MSGLGLLLIRLGFRLTASDLERSIYLDRLESHGATVWKGSFPERIKKKTIIFYSSAIPDDDPERKFARDHDIPQLSRHLLLNFLTEQFFTIAIAGTHGKTTTSAWAAMLLQEAKMHPTCIIGGNALNFNSNFIMGKATQRNKKPILVIEADESDNSFHYINAGIGMITNIEMDHPDQHDSLKELKDSFKIFINNIHRLNGVMIASLESQGQVKQLMPNKQNDLPIDRIIKKILLPPNKEGLFFQDEFYQVGLAGLHNLYNASCILALGKHLKIAHGIIAKTLKNFPGVSRRMQIIYKGRIHDNVRLHIMDDYAHHPKEIESMFNTLLQGYDRILVAWEPHRISRFCYFYHDFVSLFESQIGWENLILLPVFEAGDVPEDFPKYKELKERLDIKINLHIKGQSDHLKLLKRLRKRFRKENKNILVFMGAGRSSQMAKEFVEFLKNT